MQPLNNQKRVRLFKNGYCVNNLFLYSISLPSLHFHTKLSTSWSVGEGKLLWTFQHLFSITILQRFYERIIKLTNLPFFRYFLLKEII